MSETLQEIRKARLRKLEEIKKAGHFVYPVHVKRTHTLSEAIEGYEELSSNETEVTLTGRIREFRGHGGSTFFTIEDGTSKMQAYIKKDGIGEEEYKMFNDIFDLGDFIQVRGVLFTTKKGEKTLEVADYKMLSKSLRALPEKWHGLREVEERYRKRYLDLLFNDDSKRIFKQRSQVMRSLRGFLEDHGFMEVETPVLQPLYGGAEAYPFTTHLNAFDMQMYLRIAPELYLKRLLVGGFEKVYEIGRVFRNEGVDRSHNPDFTMLEFYWAYADYKDMMKLTENMLKKVVSDVHGALKFTYEDKEVNFDGQWERIEYDALIRKYANVDIYEVNRDALSSKAKELGVKVEEGMSKFQIADAIYKKYCLPKIWDPTFVIHHPAGSKPLAKPLEGDPEKLASFQFIVAGWEVINAFSELNDPIQQKEIFLEQEKLMKEGMEDAQRMDHDFIEALEYGMPPAAGFGLGVDRLTAILSDSHSLREVILFPTMKPRDN